jgi:hypothetical protein
MIARPKRPNPNNGLEDPSVARYKISLSRISIAGILMLGWITSPQTPNRNQTVHLRPVMFAARLPREFR